jgi:hypothetical protein
VQVTRDSESHPSVHEQLNPFTLSQNTLLQRLDQFEQATGAPPSFHVPTAAAPSTAPFGGAFGHTISSSSSSISTDLSATAVYKGGSGDSATSVFKSSDIAVMLKVRQTPPLQYPSAHHSLLLLLAALSAATSARLQGFSCHPPHPRLPRSPRRPPRLPLPRKQTRRRLLLHRQQIRRRT